MEGLNYEGSSARAATKVGVTPAKAQKKTESFQLRSLLSCHAERSEASALRFFWTLSIKTEKSKADSSSLRFSEW